MLASLNHSTCLGSRSEGFVSGTIVRVLESRPSGPCLTLSPYVSDFSEVNAKDFMSPFCFKKLLRSKFYWVYVIIVY